MHCQQNSFGDSVITVNFDGGPDFSDVRESCITGSQFFTSTLYSFNFIRQIQTRPEHNRIAIELYSFRKYPWRVNEC